MTRMTLTTLVVCSGLAAAPAAADLATYTWTFEGTGSLDGGAFAGADITLTAYLDTDDAIDTTPAGYAPGIQVLLAAGDTDAYVELSIDGVASGIRTTQDLWFQYATIDGQSAFGFTTYDVLDSGYVPEEHALFGTVGSSDLTFESSFGPTEMTVFPNLAQFLLSTDFGDMYLDSYGDISLSASVVPAPGVASLFAFCAAFLRRRRRTA